MEAKSQGLPSTVRPHGGHAPTLFQGKMKESLTLTLAPHSLPNPSPWQIAPLEAGESD